MMKILSVPLMMFMLLNTSILAQTLEKETKTRDWSDGIEIGASFLMETISLETQGLRDLKAQGISIEASKDYELNESFFTQSILKASTTSTDSGEIIEVDNKSIGLMQRLILPVYIANTVFKPSIGFGINYGGLEYGIEPESTDQQYLSVEAEGKLQLDFLNGIAPFISYSIESANLENSERDMDVDTVALGLSVVF